MTNSSWPVRRKFGSIVDRSLISGSERTTKLSVTTRARLSGGSPAGAGLVLGEGAEELGVALGLGVAVSATEPPAVGELEAVPQAASTSAPIAAVRVFVVSGLDIGSHDSPVDLRQNYGRNLNFPDVPSGAPQPRPRPSARPAQSG